MFEFMPCISSVMFLMMLIVSGYLGIRLLKYAKDKPFVFFARILIFFMFPFSVMMILFLLSDGSMEFLYIAIITISVFSVIASIMIHFGSELLVKWLTDMKKK